ncbi:DUF937 domain-containing protein [Luteimonas dalianensis]|uniref:DUF937 domain-containing protein n=1 Tax=Luteimonas dalianensis TaxID=1148196 RepID=UPI003BEF5767
MADLTQQLLAQLQGAPMQQMSSQLGIGEQQTSQAVATALPLLLGALGKNASQPQGAQALLGALQKDHAGGGSNIAGLLGSVLGGGGGRQTDGAGILGHILGSSQQRAESGLAQASGLDGNKAGQLMKMLAPLVMAFLARQTQQGDASPQALGAMLGQEEQQIRQEGGGAAGLLGAVLDQDGDGKLGLGDVLKIGGGLLGGKR